MMQRGRPGAIPRLHNLWIGSNQPINRLHIAGSDSGDHRGDLRIYRLWRRLLDRNTEICPLIDPRPENADFISGQRTGRRHLEPPVATRNPADQLTARAVTWNDYRTVVAAAHC